MKQPLKIALLGISSQYIHSNLAPWCLVNGLKTYAKADHQAVVVEGTVNEPVQNILERVILEQPDLLGVSCYIWNIQTVETLLPQVKKTLPACLIALGGPEVGFRAQDALLSFPEADFVFSGEGELPFAKLTDALCGFEELKNVPGLSCREEGTLKISGPFLHEKTQGSPYTEDYLLALNGRIAYLETSRGCPYSCAFCLSGRKEKLRQAPLDQAFADILLLANSGAKTVKLVDRTFNADRARALLILRFIASEHGKGIPEGVTFHFEIAGDLLDEDTLAFLRTVPKGLFQFEIGLQSMDEKTLRLVRRNTDMAYLIRQVRQLIQMETAHVHLDLIAGLPQEDLSAFIKGFDQAYLLRPHALQLGFLKLIHGSAMREEGGKYPCAFDPLPPYEVRSTPFMSESDFAVLKTAERALDKLHNSGRFPRTLRFLTEEMEFQPFDLFLNLGRAIIIAEGEGSSLPLDKLNDCLAGHTAIIPILVGSDENAFLLSNMLRHKGVFVPPAVFPAVPKGKARLRFCVVSEHKEEQIIRALDALVEAAQEAGIELPA
ncbi:MAG: DUF4080 domain-containing protein [Bacillota bacterium]|nr:DUF4080 domain-containing protein [Bacillota bacterium]